MALKSNVKERDLSTRVVFPIVELLNSDGTFKSVWLKGSESTYKGRQYTVSEGHYKAYKHYSSGGPFFTYRIVPELHLRNVTLLGSNASGPLRYKGPIVIPFSNTGYSGMTAPGSDDSYLDPIGAEAISIIDPTNPNAQTGVALGEIVHDKKVSLPGIQAWKRRTEVARAAGSEYLSLQFGWLPLVSDMKNTAQSVKDGNTIMENYRSSSGTLVHREFAFDDIVTESEEVVKTGVRCSYGSSSSSAFNDSPTDVTRKRNTTVKRWFSGSFTYDASHDSIERCLGYGSEADKLFGLTLTPDTVWELTPWSWAIDWFSNAGNVISNATSFGLAGLVMKYGYIMEETSIIDTYSMPTTGLKGPHGPPPDAIVKQTIKRRREANPFGFGVSWDGLTPTQLAITAALGITRLR